MIINSVKARKILNSRGEDVIEVIVESDIGSGKGSVGRGKSKGKYEVEEFVKGVDYAVDFLNKFEKLDGVKIEKFEDFEKVEDILGKYNLGGNVVVSLELGILNCFKEPWKFLGGKKLPLPLGNCVGGGLHFKGKSTDIQEFLVFSKADTFFDANFANKRIYTIIKIKLGSNKVNDENALVTNKSNLEVLEILHDVCESTSLELGFDIKIGLDFAANNLFHKIGYRYNNFSEKVKRKLLTREQQIDFVNKLIKDYDLFCVEDPLEENDFKGFEKINKKCLVIGDDLICTNLERLKKAKINGVIIKPNQIGSLIECKKVVDYAKKNGIKCIMSHRSGETMDYGIADLAVGWELEMIKCGITGKERNIKLERLKEIEHKSIKKIIDF